MKKETNAYEADVVFDDPKLIDGYYVSFVDGNGHTKYVKCTEEFFHEYRNMEREMKRQETKGTIYKVRYEDDTYKWTMEKPVHGDGHIDYEAFPVGSLDYLKEEFDLEYADADDPNDGVGADIDKHILDDNVRKAILTLDKQDREIFKLYYYGHKTDSEIAILVFKDESKRATVQRKKTAAFNAVVEFVKKFY